MDIRAPCVAGQFYDNCANNLRAHIEPWLTTPTNAIESIRALIVPHAGYMYSGHTAAQAYRHLLCHPSQFKRVVIVGPSHHFSFDSLVLPEVHGFSTPLGIVSTDTATIDSLLDIEGIVASDTVHTPEHSIEVQLPFLQQTLSEFTIIPMLVNGIAPQDLAKLIEPIWDDKTLLVISSDLSHFHNEEKAQTIDKQSCALIENKVAGLTPQQACGCTGVNALLYLINQQRYRIHKMEYSNSAQTSGNKDRVVGYVSYIISDSNEN